MGVSMKKIVVNGLTESAGKTTTVLGLYSLLQDFGDISLFKPLAGNNYWYDFSIVTEGVEEGRIFGKDAKILSKTSNIQEEIINPFHRLWAPSTVVGGLRTNEDVVVLDRIYDGEKTYILTNSQIQVPENLSPLLKNADVVEKYSRTEDHNEKISSLYPEAFRNSYSKLEKCDLLIIESYSEIGLPYKVNNIDIVITVEPGKAHISNGRKFENAASMVQGVYMNYGFKETRTSKILKLINIETIEIPPVNLENNNTEKPYTELAKTVKKKI